MMTHTEALDKARKLLRLSQSNNPHEAALAASRAQDLMARHRISQISLEIETQATAPDEPIKNFTDDPLDPKSGGTWTGRLAMALCRQNGCKVYRSGGALKLIGRPSDVSTVRYLYSWMRREIEALAERHCAGNGRTYWNNFRLGAVETIAARLREQAKETVTAVRAEATNYRALALVNNALAIVEERAADVEAWQKANFKLGRARSSYSSYNPAARQAGRTAGASISLRPSAGSLGNGGQKSLSF